MGDGVTVTLWHDSGARRNKLTPEQEKEGAQSLMYQDLSLLLPAYIPPPDRAAAELRLIF